MKKSVIAGAMGLVVGLMLANGAQAEDRAWNWSPLGVGIAAPLQLPYVDSDVYGLRLDGFYGRNNDVYGIDCGVVGRTDGDFAGLQLDCFTWTAGDAYGLQVGVLANVVNMKMRAFELGLVNVVWGDAKGWQIGAINYDMEIRGIEFGLLNWNVSESYGWQIAVANADQDSFAGAAFGVVNFSNSFSGLQMGVINTAYTVEGCQIGVANACDTMHGVQIGVFNLICNGPLPFMVIANASF